MLSNLVYHMQIAHVDASRSSFECSMTNDSAIYHMQMTDVEASRSSVERSMTNGSAIYHMRCWNPLIICSRLQQNAVGTRLQYAGKMNDEDALIGSAIT